MQSAIKSEFLDSAAVVICEQLDIDMEMRNLKVMCNIQKQDFDRFYTKRICHCGDLISRGDYGVMDKICTNIWKNSKPHVTIEV
ncbi:Hypothetical predicted protein [Octopus vulgaris]|uniref:Uncharacterized protein n=1 Tax=Octopus vulgaris TaxID=6645 RepID=A0AA36EVM6_OCTVU|nr:Hypothetical predicted protein [Octopus vulgaris]